MAEKRITIADISRVLGISTSTVSRALSGKGYVREEARKRIVEKAREMGYVPDLAARSLRQGASTQIGLVVSTLLDPFYAQLATGFQAVARAQGYDVALIIDRADSKEELTAAESLLAMGVAGVAITPVSAAALSRIAEHAIPIVQLDRMVTPKHAFVGGDNFEGARLATQHLLEHGHSRIAIVLDHAKWTTGRARLDGWRSAMAEGGGSQADELAVMLGSSTQEIDASLDRFVGRIGDEGITAIFAANSVVAEHLYTKLLDADIKVPDDVSIIAYDDLHWTSMVRPSVTVINQHVDDMGAIAAETIIRLIDGHNAPPTSTRTYIQPTLVERDSVKMAGR